MEIDDLLQPLVPFIAAADNLESAIEGKADKGKLYELVMELDKVLDHTLLAVSTLTPEVFEHVMKCCSFYVHAARIPPQNIKSGIKILPYKEVATTAYSPLTIRLAKHLVNYGFTVEGIERLKRVASTVSGENTEENPKSLN